MRWLPMIGAGVVLLVAYGIFGNVASSYAINHFMDDEDDQDY